MTSTMSQDEPCFSELAVGSGCHVHVEKQHCDLFSPVVRQDALWCIFFMNGVCRESPGTPRDERRSREHTAFLESMKQRFKSGWRQRHGLRHMW